MQDEFLNGLVESFDYLENRPSVDWPAVDCPSDRLLEFLEILKDNQGFDMLSDLTAIDDLGETPRFTVVYHLYHTQKHTYFRVASKCPQDEPPTMPSATGLWAGADWHEREAFDMFGIHFSGHPNLKRILMWDDYPYHPMRKDFPLAGKETDLPAADVALATGEKVIPAPMMGGPYHSPLGGCMSESEPRGSDESWSEKREKPSG